MSYERYFPKDYFHAVQISNIFSDSKTFPDRPSKFDTNTLQNVWQTFTQTWNGSEAELKAFVERTTDPPEIDLRPHVPSDWKEQGETWMSHLDPKVRQWALFLNQTWQDLCHVCSFSSPEAQSSLLALPNPFFIPGERFREIYYWDSYWTLLGLTACGMYSSALDQVSNLLSLLNTFGFVPNGGRKYYLNRSQPPVLSLMLRHLLEEAEANKMEDAIRQRVLETVEHSLPLLIREHQFWTQSPHILSFNGEETKLSRYFVQTDHPRPESYREDLETLQELQIDSEKRKLLFQDIATAAESGHDFSSRWFADPATLRSIQTTQILPVDLNAFLFMLESNIAYFASFFGKPKSFSESFLRQAEQRKRAFDHHFWDPATLQWRDLHVDASGKATFVREGYLTSFLPLFCGISFPSNVDASEFVKRFQNSELIKEGGCITSVYPSGQQWDAPNVWPPLQCCIIEGFSKFEIRFPGCGGGALAEDLAVRFLQNAFLGFERFGAMFEKYDAHWKGRPGQGGEYVTQKGFGWTNGSVLHLLLTHGSKFHAETKSDNRIVESLFYSERNETSHYHQMRREAEKTKNQSENADPEETIAPERRLYDQKTQM